MTKSYDIGDLLRLSARFYDSDNNNHDPEAVFLTVTTPTGVETTYTYGIDGGFIKESVGVYHLDVNITLSGYWTYRFYATGEGQTAAVRKFFVREL